MQTLKISKDLDKLNTAQTNGIRYPDMDNGLFINEATKGADKTITIPAETNIVILEASNNLIVAFGGIPASGSGNVKGVRIDNNIGLFVPSGETTLHYKTLADDTKIAVNFYNNGYGL